MSIDYAPSIERRIEQVRARNLRRLALDVETCTALEEHARLAKEVFQRVQVPALGGTFTRYSNRSA